jgi:hypothetical protein
MDSHYFIIVVIILVISAVLLCSFILSQRNWHLEVEFPADDVTHISQPRVNHHASWQCLDSIAHRGVL